MSARTDKLQGFAILAMVVLMLSFCSGCTALRTPEEMAWQTLHAADAVQTWHIVDDPCYSEGDQLTSQLIGAEPSHESVAAWAIGGAALHAGVSEFLLAKNYDTAFKLWQSVTIANTAFALGQGYAVGVRIGSPNKGCAQ